jgi:hypothetical protein
MRGPLRPKLLNRRAINQTGSAARKRQWLRKRQPASKSANMHKRTVLPITAASYVAAAAWLHSRWRAVR